MRQFLLIFLLIVTACTPTPLVNAPPQIFTIYATPATQEWLSPVYDCAAETPGMLLLRTLDIASADISLRLIPPPNSGTILYQIGEIELVVGKNVENPVNFLSKSQLADIFEGKIRVWSEVGGNDAQIELWVYEQENDIQVAFKETMLEGRTLSSLARQASNEKMVRQAISGEVNALGILSRSEISDNIRVLHSVGYYPVLMVVKTEPQGFLPSLVACLQGD